MSTNPGSDELLQPLLGTPANPPQLVLDERPMGLPWEPQAAGNFLVTSRNGNIKLRLSAQEDQIEVPGCGIGAAVAGTVELLTKPDPIFSVKVTVEGRIVVHELAENGRSDTLIHLGTLQLWNKGEDYSVRPSILPCSVTLPRTFQHDDRTYTLPPSYSAQMEGFPGFETDIGYLVNVRVKYKKFGLPIGSTAVSTLFIYRPRTRPPHAIPAPLELKAGFINSPEWKMQSSVIKAHANTDFHHIRVKLYIPASPIFYVADVIPFHLTFESNADSLAAFLPYGPTGQFHSTRFQLVRHSRADPRGDRANRSTTSVWRNDCLGEGVFGVTGEGATWSSFSSEIPIGPVTIAGFNLRYMEITDSLILTVTPPDAAMSFFGIYERIPVLLATDPWV
ncbi:hypothetical protein K438DRAFT_1994677 [Mycena galopus ATCC 62051]|nr:hypothetical protein K438DRAFT_1994677 [Mycena galopus ATCC 62051]